MTGSDVSDFLLELLDDILNIGEADLFSIALRIAVVVIGLILVAVFVKLLARMFWDVFGGLFRWLGWMLSSPYRVPQKWLRKAKYRRERKHREKEQEKQNELARLNQERHAREAEERRIEEEKKALDILNSPPDLSRFKK